MDEVLLVLQETIDRIGQVTSHLLHPITVGLRNDTGDLYLACAVVDYNKNHILDKSSGGVNFLGKKIASRE